MDKLKVGDIKLFEFKGYRYTYWAIGAVIQYKSGYVGVFTLNDIVRDTYKVRDLKDVLNYKGIRLECELRVLLNLVVKEYEKLYSYDLGTPNLGKIRDVLRDRYNNYIGLELDNFVNYLKDTIQVSGLYDKRKLDLRVKELHTVGSKVQLGIVSTGKLYKKRSNKWCLDEDKDNGMYILTIDIKDGVLLCNNLINSIVNGIIRNA